MDVRAHNVSSTSLVFTVLVLTLRSANAVATAASPIPALTYTSLVLCSAGLLVSVLLQQHLKALSRNTDDVVSYRVLQSMYAPLTVSQLDFLTGQNGKMMPLAIVLSLPRAAFVWSLLLLAAQAMVILLFSVSLPVGIAVCTVIPVLGLCIWWVLCPAQRRKMLENITNFKLSSMPSWISSPIQLRYERIPDAESGELSTVVSA